eukprot:10670059-Alexandrium_andersonii.AAC.1
MSASLVGSEMCIRDRNTPIGSFGDRLRGRSWARAVQAPNARGDFAASAAQAPSACYSESTPADGFSE